MTGDTLREFLAEPDDELRWKSLSAFVSGDPPAARVVAEHGLASDDPRIREAAADTLGLVVQVDRSAASGIATVLLARLEAEADADPLGATIVALGHAGDPRAKAAVTRRAAHPDARVRRDVAWALPSFGLDAGTMAVLRQLSRDPDRDVRDWATFGLGISDALDEATVEALAARADDPDDDTRAEAIYGLARRHDARARPLIERELDRPFHGTLIEEALTELES